ncbi:MAG: hypothetical protein M1828_001885 [Chrysothrix sp. TS-e1954]|nr:MAG: hypothetical protein M1828_001885 [Chrysothrix sp. TS-e1954]
MTVVIPPWEAKAAAKRADILAKIPKEWILNSAELGKASKQRDLTGLFIEQYLSVEETAITKERATILSDKLRNGSYRSKDVVRAFCKRAALAQQMNNCLHEIFFDEALQRAEELDEYYARNQKPIGPLHGLPISLKDQFHVRGNATSMGYIGWLDTYEGNPDPQLVYKTNSQIVSELLSLGAVLYCKTSLPQTLLYGETINNIIGRTLNPVNQNLSCGGSSGGEGALSALGASPVGVGTDIGGSVRIPAAFCGIFSIKPSHDRFSYRNVANVIPGESTYSSSVGFMSSEQDALPLLMESVLSLKPWLSDPRVVPIPWRKDVLLDTISRATSSGSANDKLPLKIGMLWNDGVVTPQPPIQRGLRLVAQAVKRAGHKLAFLKADGAHNIHAQLDLSGEPLIPPLRGGSRLRDAMPVDQYQDLTVEGREYEEKYLDYWNSTNEDNGQLVDAVVMPVAPHAAVIPGKYYHTDYTESINLMDYTSTVIPVTTANQHIDKVDESFRPLTELDAKNWNAYDPEVYDGAPVGVQIVGRKYEEEKIWAVGKIIYLALQMQRTSTQ